MYDFPRLDVVYKQCSQISPHIVDFESNVHGVLKGGVGYCVIDRNHGIRRRMGQVSTKVLDGLSVDPLQLPA